MAKEIIILIDNNEELTALSNKSIEYAKNYLPDKVKNKWLNILK